MTSVDYVPDPYAFEMGGDCLYCDKPAHSRKLCSKHYTQFWRKGKITVRPKPKNPKPRVRLAEAEPCRKSKYDFITWNRDGTPVVITGKTPRDKVRHQLAVCARCTTKEECLERAERFGAEYGIWGGLLPHERRDR